MLKMYQVDAFTQDLFKGNSAAVIILDEWLDESLMQNIALENNLSETAFLKANADESYHIRWFTPTDEVAFCGHATLASAFILFKENIHLKQLHFTTNQVGDFYIQQQSDGLIEMEFPIRMPTVLEEIPQGLVEALGTPFKALYVNDQAYVVEYEHAEQVLELQPDFLQLKTVCLNAKVKDGNTKDVVITAPSDQAEYNFISRYFAPAIGVHEDPVTGSIHTALAPFWSQRFNKPELVAYQASTRGGVLYCKQLSAQRMQVSGYAKLYMVAEIFV
ncbi:PhzF family phenazine biosynthesis protein [Acinetobacter rathckeae]|uniref:PhzF family phenazine biosynthesis protein n=1 Tax=Acinetobacter rathckeae TaxID=2605272 RepID=UPI0018A333E5|nr:PhzF family phenazine biosynthesis protein [Acinetobacter rathckeae]MBF7686912.1 PhzF family phenazine biosynthesis protein [Acinetobacter rathckeae]MBF7694684.1 PhzF family phenazine biosynthesis protein [Acinetobacter rathckeae]